jgi:group I intron endonuclease
MYSIYQIVNNINNKRYVGFTSLRNPRTRFIQHSSKSKRGSKSPIHCAIRKYGKNNFHFEILEQGEDGEYGKNIVEPMYIEWMVPEYNLTRGGEGAFGYKHTEQSKSKLSQKLKGRTFSDDHIRNLVIARSFRKVTESWKINNGEGHAKIFIITSPTGQSYTIKNLRKFCRQNNLHQGYMVSIAKGKNKSYKGWRCKYP